MPPFDTAAISHDPAGTLIGWTPAAEALLGYTVAEVIGTSVYSLFPEDQAARYRELVVSFRENSGVRSLRGTALTKDRQRVEVVVRSQATFDAGGSPAIVSLVLSAPSNCTWSDSPPHGRTAEPEEQLSQIEDTVPVAVYSFRLGSNGVSSVPFASRRFWDMWAVDPAQVALDGSAIFDRVHEDDRQPVIDSISESAHCLRDWQAEFRVQHPTRGQIWIEGHSVPQREPDGGTLWRGVLVDITDRKRQEKLLRESEAKLNSMVSSALNAVILIEDTDKIAVWNPAAERMFGYANAEVLGRSLHELIAPERYRQAFAAGLERFHLSGEGEALEKTIAVFGRRKDGTEFPVELTISPVRIAGEAPKALGVVRDVSDRRRAEVALMESEERWQFALEGAGDGLWDWDIETNEVYYSKQWKAMLGHEDHEVGTSITEWESRVHPEDLEQVKKQIQDYFSGLAPLYACEHRMLCKDGTYKWILDRGKIIRYTAEGKPARVIGTHTDVTPRKQQEAEKERLRAQLLQAQKMESIGRLAGGVAHDFNNLLTVINGFASLALNNIEPQAASRDLVEEIQKAGERATGLVRQLLAFSRRQLMRAEPIDCNETVRGMVPMLRRLMGQEIEIVTDLAPALPNIRADRHQIEQVLMNLAINARDALLPGGGRLTISSQEFWREDICKQCHTEVEPGRYIHLAVRDTGCGMDEPTRQRVFEPFFTTKDVGKGTGLGLAVVHGIVLQSGGHIEVDSASGSGTTFNLYFPAIAETSIAPEDKVEIPLQGTGTVLLVEDQDEVRRYVSAVLTSRGYKVHSAASAEAAMAILKQHHLDLLLTDLVMPKTNGRELALAALELHPGLKVLYMSGFAGDAAGSPGHDLPGGFLQKPFSPDTLAREVSNILNSETTPTGTAS